MGHPVCIARITHYGLDGTAQKQTLVGEVCGVAAGPVDGAEVDDLGVVQVRVVVARHQHELVGHCDGGRELTVKLWHILGWAKKSGT